MRVAYQWRQAAREYVLDPIQSATLGDALLLSNSSRSRCREFEVTTRYTFRRTDELKVLCAFEGDRNDFNSYYGNLIVGAFSDRHGKKAKCARLSNRCDSERSERFRISDIVSPARHLHRGSRSLTGVLLGGLHGENLTTDRLLTSWEMPDIATRGSF